MLALPFVALIDEIRAIMLQSSYFRAGIWLAVAIENRMAYEEAAFAVGGGFGSLSDGCGGGEA